MRLNRTSEWKVMTVSISQELPLFNFERLDMWCSWIGPPCDNLWPFEFLERFRFSISSISIYDVIESDIRVKSYDNFNFSRASVVQFRASQYKTCLNRTFEWKVMTISITQELPWFNFGRLHMWCAWIGPPCEKLWPFEFLERFRCSISSVMIYCVPKSNIRVKSYDHLNFSRFFLVQFRACWYIMCQNRSSDWKVMTIQRYYQLNYSSASVIQFRAYQYIMFPNTTSEWKVMTIWISRELPLFNIKLLDIWCPWVGHPCEKLWPFKFRESFRCSI